MTWVIAAIGWLGAASLLAAYLLLLRHQISADGRAYLCLNFLGSAGLAVSTSAAHAWPSAAVNVIWLVIGVGPLIRAASRRRARRPACPRPGSRELASDHVLSGSSKPVADLGLK